jgi:selenocysteine lyase/cysteine desulfurase
VLLVNEFVEYVRNQFPALDLAVNDYQAAFLDGPGGYQLPNSVIDAVNDYLINKNANVGGAYLTSRRTVETIQSAREAFHPI